MSVDAGRPRRPAGNIGEEVAYTRQNFDDSSWRQLNLPHDWGIEGPFQQELPGETGKLPWAGIGWYRKHFTVQQADKGKQIYIDFDGAMSHSTVWLNGKFVGGWPYGYASFRLDLTPYIEFGRENVIAVRLDNPPESSRWYPGSGLYRNVWLVKTARVHVGHWGTFVTTPTVTKESASVNVKVTLDNDSSSAAEIAVKTSIYKLVNGKKAGSPMAASPSTKLTIAANTNQVTEVNLTVGNPSLWSTQTPNLYTAVTQIEKNGKVIDTYETNFGIRTIKFDADKGFLLNGEHVYIKGVCDHHDLGALGSAINVRALERQIEILKDMGVNAIRTSHNPPAPELLDLADRMGILILDEAFDAWVGAKKKNDYSTLFKDWHEKDLRAFIRRDRNHPSIIAWSIGNEIREQRPDGH
ncbi:MAG TPA: glycoside hydrolase family 2 TIM barrel-domain containing protein, partial [Pyrinomonadaceae bacterium]|nr:glycoside hydrolase family 2 TIM barrel-domain containing protein [Pyrinomonadaceae bacterium]